MVFNAADAAAIAGWSAFVIVTHTFDMRKEDLEWYEERKPVNLPRWIFGVVWGTLCLFNIASIYLFNKFSINTEHYTFVAVNVLFIVNQMLEMLWTPLFFRARRLMWALIIAILISSTAVTLAILMGLADENIPVKVALAFILIGAILHALWVSFAVYLNARWVQSVGDGKPSRRLKDEK